jgi:prepilin-type N-terminal cleavage/methylation domain-containing protein
MSGTSRRHDRGFTIIELLVVIFIVGLLISMLVPQLYKARELARRTVCISHLKQIGSSTFAYAFDSNDLGPQVMRRAGTRAPRSLLSRSGKYVNLGLLLENELEGQHDVLYCPSQQQFSYNSDPQYLPQATVTGSYAYAVHIATEESPMLGRVRHLALISDDYTGRLGAKYGVGRYTHRDGYNVLYTDGSATWYKDVEEKISRRAVHWDDETDDITYDSLYQGEEVASGGSYGDDLDVFRVWWAFCYNKPVSFPDTLP